mgnify:CR=1 FL=1
MKRCARHVTSNAPSVPCVNPKHANYAGFLLRNARRGSEQIQQTREQRALARQQQTQPNAAQAQSNVRNWREIDATEWRA